MQPAIVMPCVRKKKGGAVPFFRKGDIREGDRFTFFLNSLPALADMLSAAASLLRLVRHPMRRLLLAD